MLGFGRLFRLSILSFMAAIITVAAANSATISKVEIEQKRKQLFAMMMAQPDNLEVAFTYASLSSQVGDLEAAVSTLERMLIFAPGLPRVQLELGVLYFRLGNNQIAKDYFQSAISGPNVPDEVKSKVAEYLKAIDQKLKPFRWSSTTYAGIRWQDNANAAPSSRDIGNGFLLDSNSTKKSDFSLLMADNAHFEYDLEMQGDRIEADYVDFSTYYFKRDEMESMVAEFTIGPSFNLDRFDFDDAYASIYAITNGSLLSRKLYFGTLGVGSRLVSRPNPDTEFTLKAEYRHRWFDKNRKRPLAKSRNGDEYRGSVTVAHLFNVNLRGDLTGQISRDDVKADYLDKWEYGAQANLSLLFASPIAVADMPWAVGINSGYLHRNYDHADTTLSAKAQRDNEYWLGGSLKVPLTEKLSLLPRVEYRKVDSNYKIRKYKAFTATFGVHYVW